MRGAVFVLLALLAVPAAARTQGGISSVVATYSGRAEYQGQTQDLGMREITVTDSVVDGAQVWVVVNRMKIDRDAGADSVVMRRGDLAPLARHVAYGPSRLTLDLRDSLLVGQLKANGQNLTLSIRPGVRSFLNYYALRTALREWPVAAGWRTTAGALELVGRAEFTPLTLEVVGEERLRVPAGEFDCWVVHVTGAGRIDERWWVSKTSRHVVRTREPVGRQGAILQLDLVSLDPPP